MKIKFNFIESATLIRYLPRMEGKWVFLHPYDHILPMHNFFAGANTLARALPAVWSTLMKEGMLALRPPGVGDGTRLQKIINFIEHSESLKAGVESKAL